MSKLVCGVGINDANYLVHKYENIKGKKLLTWTCPFYQRWTSMLSRCYVNKSKDRSYVDCSVVQQWHYFMIFKSWMETQDWEGKQLDKDLLFQGNKVYSPETCVFIDQKVNLFMTERQNDSGGFPVGVSLYKPTNRFRAYCNDVLTGKKKHLGYYNTPEEAYEAWMVYKLEQATILASMQPDQRIAEAIVKRYQSYKIDSNY